MVQTKSLPMSDFQVRRGMVSCSLMLVTKTEAFDILSGMGITMHLRRSLWQPMNVMSSHSTREGLIYFSSQTGRLALASGFRRIQCTARISSSIQLLKAIEIS